MQTFEVRETRAVAGNPLWEVRRVRDNQCMTEPFRTARECRDWLNDNADDLILKYGA